VDVVDSLPLSSVARVAGVTVVQDATSASSAKGMLVVAVPVVVNVDSVASHG